MMREAAILDTAKDRANFEKLIGANRRELDILGMMKRVIQIVLAAAVGLVVLGIAAYFIWFRNPYLDELQLDAAAVFGKDGAASTLFIRDATLIDVESPTRRSPIPLSSAG